VKPGWRLPTLVGRGSRKAGRFTRGEVVDTIDSTGWVGKRAEPWHSAGPRLGESIGLIRYSNRYPSVSLVKPAVFWEPRPTKVGSHQLYFSLFTFHIFRRSLGSSIKPIHDRFANPGLRDSFYVNRRNRLSIHGPQQRKKPAGCFDQITRFT